MRRAMRRILTLALAMGAASAMAVGQSQPYQPKFPGDPAHSEAEAGALGYMRTLLSAQRDYKKKFNKYAPSLYALSGGARSFTKRMARTDRGDYTVSFHGGGNYFSVALTPKVFDADHRAFYLDQTGTFRAETDKPATGESPPL